MSLSQQRSTMSTKTNKKNVVYSYLRDLAITSAGIALAVVKTKHTPLLHLTKTDLLTIANAVWLAVLPQFRFAIKPYITRYLKKNPNFFIFLLKYLPSNIAGAVGGYIYTSSDHGVTWTKRTNILAGKRVWSIASNSTGKYVVAEITGRYIYTSSDHGVTWTQRTNILAGKRVWSIASDSGLTWIARSVFGYWKRVTPVIPSVNG